MTLTKESLQLSAVTLLSGIVVGVGIGMYGIGQQPKPAPSPAVPNGTIIKEDDTKGAMKSSNYSMDAIMVDMTAALRGKRGDAFDREFLNQMIPYAQGAVDIANQALNDGSRPELKEMAQRIIGTQQQDIQQMRAWQQQWYGGQQ